MAERPEDLSLPASVVARIIKDALPEGVNVSKEARTAVGKAASVFILYATACANNFALKAKRKTLSANDVLSALEDMEFEHFVPELKECLEAFKQEQKEKKESQAVRKRKKVSGANATPPHTTSPHLHQPHIQSDTSSGSANFMKQATSADSASSSQGEDEGSMEVDPVISAQPSHQSSAQLAVNSSI